jgi:hypothetical protein
MVVSFACALLVNRQVAMVCRGDGDAEDRSQPAARDALMIALGQRSGA